MTWRNLFQNTEGIVLILLVGRFLDSDGLVLESAQRSNHDLRGSSLKLKTQCEEIFRTLEQARIAYKILFQY